MYDFAKRMLAGRFRREWVPAVVVEVVVIRGDIDRDHLWCGDRCPLERAIRRRIPGAEVRVYPKKVRISDGRGNEATVPLPRVAADFLRFLGRRGINRHLARPFWFTMEVPPWAALGLAGAAPPRPGEAGTIGG